MKKLLTFCLGFILVWTLCFPTVHAAEPQPDDEIAAMQELLDDPNSWYNSALTSDYATPSDIDLHYFFYRGFSEESQTPTAAEEAFLDEHLPSYWKHMDLYRLPVEKMDVMLMEYFGITFADTNGVGTSQWLYWEETNCFYAIYGGSHSVSITVRDVIHQDDGTLKVYYRRPCFKADVVVTLMPHGDGYRILSNLPVVDRNTYWETYDWDNFSWRDIDGAQSDGSTIRSLFDWLETDAPFHYVFFVESRSDGYLSGMTGPMICQRFEETPLTFIRELAKENLKLQLLITERLVRHSYYDEEYNIPLLIQWLDEDALELQVEKDILQLMRDNVLRYWGDEIPETGDAVIPVAAAMLLSAAAAAVLLTKKRKITGDL